ncbi:MAG: glycosyltransferase family 4 protein [Planctomycetota bacterium]
MRILFINQTYAPDVAASAQLLEDMARQFADHGHEVAVITSRSLYGKKGATLPRYEMRDGVAVHRVGVSRFGKGSVPARTFDAGMFYLAAIWKAWRVRLPGGRPQVTVTLTSPPYIGFIGALARIMQGGRRRGRFYVNWTMDLYPDVLLAAGLIKPRSLAGRFMLRLNKWCLKLSDRVVVLGRCMKDRLVEQGIAPDKIDIISVWPVSPVLSLEEAARPSGYRERWGLQDKFTVMYSGNLGLAHETQTIYDAALKLRDRDDIRFVFVGGGKRRPGLSRFVAEHGLTNVVEKGYEPREQLADLLRLGDVHLISQRPEFVGVVVPSKLFGIMASCRPALYVGPGEAEVARVIDESGAGLIFDSGEADQLAAAIERLADDRDAIAAMGRATHDATVKHHTLRHRFLKLEALLEGLVAPHEQAAATKPAPEPLRVLLVNQAYAPDAAATAQHCEDLAQHLIARGHGVSVIASRSIYGQAGANLPRRETLDGVHVHRVGLSLFGKRGLALRALDFGLFYIAALWRAVWVSVPIDGRRKKPDVVVTLTTPPFVGGVGVLLRWLRGCRHIYWAMDLYPDVLVAAGLSQPHGMMTRMLAALNRWEMRRADRVVALGRCMRDLIESQGIKPAHIDVIGVWAPTAPDDQVADPAASSYRETWNLHGKFVVQYSGNFGLAHDYQTFCDAMRLTKHRDDIVFLFAGGGKRVETVKAYVEQHGLTNVMFQPYQPRENLPDLLTLANVHLISQSQTFTGIVVPSKLFGIMAAGRASLFVGPAEAEVARVLDETGGGRRFNIGAAKALADTVLELADDPSRAAHMGQAALDAARGPHHQTSRYAAWESLLVGVSRRELVQRRHAPGVVRPTAV